MSSPLDTSVPRRLLLLGQGMLEDRNEKATLHRVHKRVEALGFVQVDSIPVVARAHDHILWTRLSGYRPPMLRNLVENKRKLFEHWTHDASILPVSSLPYWRVRFRRYRANPSQSQWWRDRLGEDLDRMSADLLSRIQASGSLRSRHLEGSKRSSSSWWGWKREKAVLEYLWRIGQLGISARVNFEKVYALMEEMHAADGEPVIDEAEYRDWCCRRALEGLGMATPQEIAAYYRCITLAEARSWCKTALESKRIVEVEAATLNGARACRYLALPGWKRRASLASRRLQTPQAEEIRLLSPFDPILRDRKRTQRLFGFDYRFEAFVPAAKRRYGYYVLPLLRGETLIGRLDAKLHRDLGLLEVKGLWWEPGFGGRKAPLQRLRAVLTEYQHFLGAKGYRLPRGDLRSCRP